MIVAGVALMISFELAFKRAGTEANPVQASMCWLRDGPYRFSRNPAYLGMAITYVGVTLAAEAPWALLMLAGDAGDPVRSDRARGAVPRGGSSARTS